MGQATRPNCASETETGPAMATGLQPKTRESPRQAPRVRLGVEEQVTSQDLIAQAIHPKICSLRFRLCTPRIDC